MNNNFLIMIFFSIGVIATVKFIIKIIIELRAYWLGGNFKTKRECFYDFFYRKLRNEPIIVYNNSFNYYNYDDDYDDYDCYDYDEAYDNYNGNAYEDNRNNLNYDDIEECENEIEVTMYRFKNIKVAQACCKKLNQSDRYIYNIKGKTYALVEAVVSQEEMVKYGAIVIDDEEKYDVFMEILDDDTKCFEFLDEQSADFIINRFKGGKKTNYLGHVFVDFSEKSDEEMPMIRRLAEECFGLEVSDKFLVKKLKSIKSN